MLNTVPNPLVTGNMQVIWSNNVIYKKVRIVGYEDVLEILYYNFHTLCLATDGEIDGKCCVDVSLR